MNTLEALILGLVQGLTEFLPISSSGHLVLAEHLLGVAADDLTFEVAVHFATLIAVLVFFVRTVISVFTSPIRYLTGNRSDENNDALRLFFAVFVGTIPAVIVGLLLKDQIERAFASSTLVSLMLIVTSLILFSTRFARTRSRRIGPGMGFIIGCAQAFAILPGISRSGSTISAGLLSGVDRAKAFDFSFVLSIPAILGATALTLKDLIETGNVAGGVEYIVAMAAAFVSGYLSLIFLRKIVIHGKFHLFGVYTLIAGILSLIFL